MKGREIVASFNLIDEKWILVIDNDGDTKEISLKELFSNAEDYKDLAGEMKTQDFAVLRILLAILQTVFSRFDANGNPYEYLELDEIYRQLEDIDEDDIKDYKKDLKKTWKTLWQAGHFPDIVNEYLEKWHDRFYLFDDKYPFMQVTEEELDADIYNKGKKSSASKILLKTINRNINESDNKISLFSPRLEYNKDNLTYAELSRWMICFQGYTGFSDKATFTKDGYEIKSKGWLFLLGGIYLSGNNIFETLMLNLCLVHPIQRYIGNKQNPSWENEPKSIISNLFQYKYINNLSELYTLHSRALVLSKDSDNQNITDIKSVKLPGIESQNQDLELMTMWQYHKKGKYKNSNTPKKHLRNYGLWKSFGLLTLGSQNNNWSVGIITNLFSLNLPDDYTIRINSVTMEEGGSSSSALLSNEIYDYLNIDEYIVTDLNHGGWVIRIYDTVEETKQVVDKVYKYFLNEVKLIRNQQSENFVEQNVENLYFLLNEPFKNWLSSITLNDSKDKKIEEWRNILEKIVRTEADRILANANPRDYKGVTIDEKTHNIITAYNSFNYFLNKQLRKEV